jgi:hypothetical protein
VLAVGLTIYGVIHSHDPDCRECGGGFFAGLIAAYGFVAWSVGAVIGTGLQSLVAGLRRPRQTE